MDINEILLLISTNELGKYQNKLGARFPMMYTCVFSIGFEYL